MRGKVWNQKRAFEELYRLKFEIAITQERLGAQKAALEANIKYFTTHVECRNCANKNDCKGDCLVCDKRDKTDGFCPRDYCTICLDDYQAILYHRLVKNEGIEELKEHCVLHKDFDEIMKILDGGYV